MQFFGILVLVKGLVGVSGQTTLHFPPLSFSSPGLSTNQSRRRQQGGGTQEALLGAQVVLLHWAVLVALVAGTVHFVITDGQSPREEKIRLEKMPDTDTFFYLLFRDWKVKVTELASVLTSY